MTGQMHIADIKRSLVGGKHRQSRNQDVSLGLTSIMHGQLGLYPACDALVCQGLGKVKSRRIELNQVARDIQALGTGRWQAGMGFQCGFPLLFMNLKSQVIIILLCRCIEGNVVISMLMEGERLYMPSGMYGGTVTSTFDISL